MCDGLITLHGVMINNNSAKYLVRLLGKSKRDLNNRRKSLEEMNEKKVPRNTTQGFQFSNDRKWGKSVGRTSNVGDLSILVY